MTYGQNLLPFNCLAIKLHYVVSDVTGDQKESGFKENVKIPQKTAIFLHKGQSELAPYAHEPVCFAIKLGRALTNPTNTNTK